MNKMKKIIITIIIGLIGILGINTISDAYSVGETIRAGYNDYMNNENMFCVQHKQALTGPRNYKIISNVKIEGNDSIDHNGNKITHSYNAKLAAILNGTDSSKPGGNVQNSIWNFFRTWMGAVGKHHAGLSLGFTNAEVGKPNDLDTQSSEYADEIKDMDMKDNTNKNNIKVVAYNKDGREYLRVGPFNWSFAGSLTEISAYDQNNNAIGGIIYSKFNGNTENWCNLGDINSGSDFYISVPLNTDLTKITKITGNARVNLKSVNIWFLECQISSYQNMIIREPYSTPKDISTTFDYNISTQGDLKVIKVNKDNHTVKLANVGFKIKYKNTGKYIHQDEKGKISYVDEKDATEFITDANGEILVKNLIVGTYIAYETKNPNYGYEMISDGVQKTIVIDKTNDFVIENKQIYVKLSGYVWVDKNDGKQSLRNDLFKDNNYDDVNDILLDGITVRLKDKITGQIVKNKDGQEMKATTKDGGAYLFIDVLIEKLSDYYIEFEYDGLTYTNVIPHIEKDNGSKSAENAMVRDEFNKNFSKVEGKTENTGITRDANGNEKHNLSYNLDKTNYKSTLINNGQYVIQANTDEGKYNIRAHFTYGQEEIKYINLGLYEREQPDMALVKDLENVRVGVNGYQHIYQYAQRFVNQGEYGNGFNVGVKFGNKYNNMTYTRAIYKADYEYINENDKSKELKVYVTYKLAVKNESSNLITQVNSIADYYDSKYKMIAAGTGLDEKGNVTGSMDYTESTYNSKYSKAIINNNTRVEPQKEGYIYVQFELNREAVLNILNDKANLDNVSEINSYSIFDTNGNIYAGIDKDSNPGNCIPEEKSTYQDDTDSSPALKLEVADARTMAGKVFLDSTTGELITGKIRQGSGAYEDGETEIAGVDITLTENTGSGKVYKAVTDDKGNFYISDYIPGDYTLTYTWGDKTYTVQNYKGTIYDASRDQGNKNWYKENVDSRLSDAIDDYELRQKIDEEIKYITNSTKTTIDKMNSTTPTMGVGVEYETTYSASSGDRYTYEVKNIDFGIVERARQDLGLIKRIKSMKVTLTNGQIITDITIDENGNISGEKNHVSYMGPSNNNPKNGFVKLELDNELLQGAVVEVGYEIKATNNSELDYLSENYYKYGKIEGNVVTINPTGIIDYLDKNWAFDPDKNSEWKVKSLDEIKDIVAEVVYNNEETTINDKLILYTDSLKEKSLEPTKSATVMLNVSKILTTSDEVSLDNETEITEINKTGGSKTISTPGNYIPGTGRTESDDSMAETTIVTPSTGGNLAYILPITIGVIALVILGAGIVIIKKKTLNK